MKINKFKVGDLVYLGGSPNKIRLILNIDTVFIDFYDLNKCKIRHRKHQDYYYLVEMEKKLRDINE